MRFRALALIAALPAALVPQVSLAEIKSWVLIGESDVALGIYIDSSRIERAGSTVNYWTKTVMRPDNPNKWNQYEIYYEGDCEKRRAKILQYSIIFTDGRIENNPGGGGWEDAKPKTQRGDTLAFACKE